MSKSFIDLPVEINLQILKECGTNDVTCLSLTCKYLYHLAGGIRVHNPSLSTVDSRLCHNHKSLEKGRARRLRTHRRVCHEQSRAVHEGHELLRDVKIIEGACKTPCWTTHCECYVVTLYKRLEGWMGPRLRFCANCRKFTYRCSRDSRYCGMNARRAEFDVREMQVWKFERELGKEVDQLGLFWRLEGLCFVMTPGSSQNGAARTKSSVTQIQETQKLMMQEGREEVLKKRLELKIREGKLRKRETEISRREEEMSRREYEISKWEGEMVGRQKMMRKNDDGVTKDSSDPTASQGGFRLAR